MQGEFIGFPIELYVEKSKEKEVTDSEDEGEEAEKKEEGDEPKIEEVDEEKEKEARLRRVIDSVNYGYRPPDTTHGPMIVSQLLAIGEEKEDQKS